MSKASQLLIAGFGGQGVQFCGKFLAMVGLNEGREVSYLSSYGPEVRGGTSNCSVIISDEAVGSPIVTDPEILVALNLPSLDKFESRAVPGAKIFVDSSLIDRKVEREDTENFYMPATQMASDNGLTGFANMIMLGYLVRKSEVVSYDEVLRTVEKMVAGKKPGLLEKNLKALDLGYNYNN